MVVFEKPCHRNANSASVPIYERRLHGETGQVLTRFMNICVNGLAENGSQLRDDLLDTAGYSCAP